MTTSRTTTSEMWELPENAAQRLPAGIGIAVRVERGTVLVTQEGDLDDHVLERGDEFVLSRSGLAVAWALSEAALSIHPAVHRMAA
ncbi:MULTISPECIES: DUF2917 domain-containing protein [Anaeromyxobacter]|uniref:DUF2917 domain-containing protein n=1 Tax=Anaeromyxobacter TaxID=161492 RepID=UPI001F5774DC|nr:MULTISPECIES: DUF2917 domain-containing protein [unclassified Anaeromyxobacter]